MEELFITAVSVSYSWHIKVHGKEPIIFMCSPEIFVYVFNSNKEATILGRPIEVDETLFGMTNAGFYWL